MKTVIVWDIETVPDLKGFAAAHGHEGKTDDEIRAELGEKFPKHIYHSIICIDALIAHKEDEHWVVDALGAPHVGERSERDLIAAFVSKIAELKPQLVTFNGSSFDLPVLRYRAMVHKVSALGLSGHSAHMLRSYKKTICRYWKDYVGKKPLRDVSLADMEEYEHWRSSYWQRWIDEQKRKKSADAAVAAERAWLYVEIDHNFMDCIRSAYTWENTKVDDTPIAAHRVPPVVFGHPRCLEAHSGRYIILLDIIEPRGALVTSPVRPEPG